jgi:hypothetical protein
MRINTTDDYEYRLDLYDRAADVFQENTRTGGIDRACRHAKKDHRNKEEALDWMVQNLTLSQAKELASILSTREMQLSVDVDTDTYTE